MSGSFKNVYPVYRLFLGKNPKTFLTPFGFAACWCLFLLFSFAAVPSEVNATSPQLKISGNQIVNASSGCTVRLKGVDFSGMEYSPTGDGGTGRPTTTVDGVVMTDYVSIITEAVSVWHANCVRFPLNQDFWFGCTNSKGTPNQAAYHDEIQAVVNYCSSNNVYLDMDLHWSGTSAVTMAPCGTGWGTATGQEPMPDMNAVTFWSSVASTYANNSAVMFDLYNEPYDPSGSDTTFWATWRNGGTTGSNPSSTPGLQALLAAVRGAGANNIVVAGGLNWAFDLRGVVGKEPGSTTAYALTDTASGNGVLYSGHCYDDKVGTAPTVGTVWDPYVTVATSTVPVMIEEFGASASDGAAWDDGAISWIDGYNDGNGNTNTANPNGYVYSATAWCFSSDDGPTLLTSYSGFAMTSYHGAPVSTWLADLYLTPTPNCSGGGSTPTFTSSPTNSPSATPTPTRTNSPTSTVTATVSSTATRTATATASSSPTATRTASPTSTATMTATKTVSMTPSATASQTPTASLTATGTASFTATPSASPTNTLMNSATSTFTATMTATKTASMTPSATASRTPTASLTATGTASPTVTPSPTGTASASPTNSATRTSTATATDTLATSATPTFTATTTATKTVSMTPSATASQTPTASLTATGTASPTATPSPTETASASPTNSATRTSTATATDTLATSATPTFTATMTATYNPTNSPTSTSTATVTDTLINTGTPTATATFTVTLTRTVTPTSSPTAVTVSVSQGTTPTGNSTQVPGASGVPIQQIQMINPGNIPVTLSSITIYEPSGPSPTGISSVNLLKNGAVVATASFSGNSATFNFNDVIPGASGAVTYEVTANFSPTALTGNYQFGVSGAAGSNGQPALFGGIPMLGSLVTIAPATATFTPTITSTLTPLPTATALKTATPSAKPTVIVFPNPATGGTVQLNPGLTSASNVSVEIFTVAFRKVAVLNDADVQPGVSLPVPLVDKGGTPLASGLYYLVVQTNQGRTIVKLLILR